MPRVISLSASLNTQTSTLRDLGTSFARRIIRHWLTLGRHSTPLSLAIRVLTTLSRPILILLTLPVWILLPLALLALVTLFALRLLFVRVAWVVRVVFHCFAPVWF